MKKDKIKENDKLEETKNCNCNTDCDCGCQDGKECTCDNNCECSCDYNDAKVCQCEGECDCSNDEVKKLESEILELKNKLLYKDAELINYRKRKEEETSTLLKYASQDLILDIVSSVDNFERAIDSIKKDDEKDNTKILTGIEMIYNELKNTLTKYEIREINEANVLFDANIHNAVMVDNIDDLDDDIVIEIMIKGYIYKDRVIRPAMVKVNKK